MNLFDILGPVMIGPSSSHTAGAARIGRVGRQLLGEPVQSAIIYLHGSFAKTYQGHGTDKAIIGGLLDMSVDDPRLRCSHDIAKQEGLQYVFQAKQIKNAHPNTVALALTGKGGAQITLQAASVGGGNIMVQYLNGIEVGFTGECTTLVLKHMDVPGVITKSTYILAKENINIATMRVFRANLGGEAVMVIELDGIPSEQVLDQLRNQDKVEQVILINKL